MTNDLSAWRPLIASPIKRWLWITVGFLAYASYRCSVILLFFIGREFPDWHSEVLSEFLSWLVLLALMPILLWFARINQPGRSRIWRFLFAHGVMMVFIGYLHTYLWKVIEFSFQRPLLDMVYTMLWEPRVVLMWTGVLNDCYKYVFIVGGYYLLLKLRNSREAEANQRALELKTSGLEAQLAQAQLETLRNQIDPHFLFNTLNSISVLITSSPEDAKKVLLQLSKLLRSSIAIKQPLVPLVDEIEFTRGYLDIEKVRIGGRLKVKIDVADDVGGFDVPSMILQPLVENAVRHGIANSSMADRIRIEAKLEGRKLVMTVFDNGPGPKPEGKPGIGLENIRRRLEVQYGGQAELTLAHNEGDGTYARLILPLVEST